MNKRQKKKHLQVSYRWRKETKRKEQEYQVTYLRNLGLFKSNTRPRQFGKAFQKEIRT